MTFAPQPGKTVSHTRAVLVTTGLVAAVMFVQIIISFIVSVMYSIGFSGGEALRYMDSTAVSSFSGIITSLLPVAIGVFVGFRLIAPITAGLSIIKVLIRAVIATGIAAVVALIISVLGAILSLLVDLVSGDSDIGGSGFLSALANGVGTFVGELPLVALAAVLLWLWLRKSDAAATRG